MQSLTEVVSENVRFYRKKTGLSQLKLAYQLEMAPSYLAEIERGKQYPSLKVVERLASCFKIEPYQLLYPPVQDSGQRMNMETERELRDLKIQIDGIIEDRLKKL